MISIITPVKNGRRFIQDCLDGVSRQGVAELEHILVDGCSTDGTTEIIEAYAARHPHVRLVSGPDRGQSDALNKGTRLASRPVVGILNVDDFYEPATLRLVVARFAALPDPSILIGKCRVLDDRGATLFINNPKRLRVEDLLIRDPRNPRVPVNPSAYFYHRSLHEAVGGYDVNDHFMMDLDFLIRALTATEATFVDRILGNYRLIPGTKTFHALGTAQMEEQYWMILNRYYATASMTERLEIQWKTRILQAWETAARVKRRFGRSRTLASKCAGK